MVLLAKEYFLIKHELTRSTEISDVRDPWPLRSLNSFHSSSKSGKSKEYKKVKDPNFL